MNAIEVKFSALGVMRAHLQDVVQIDFAIRLEERIKALEAALEYYAMPGLGDNGTRARDVLSRKALLP